MGTSYIWSTLDSQNTGINQFWLWPPPPLFVPPPPPPPPIDFFSGTALIKGRGGWSRVWREDSGTLTVISKLGFPAVSSINGLIPVFNLWYISQARASTDYQPSSTYASNEQWRQSATHLFADAVGLSPFKDVFWTTHIQPDNYYKGRVPHTDTIRTDVPVMCESGHLEPESECSRLESESTRIRIHLIFPESESICFESESGFKSDMYSM